MNIEVYYFSGTGNSLVIARDIAEKTKGRLISIASVIKNEIIKTDSTMIGIVFPVYFFENYPLIIERFIRKLQNIESKYLFAICSYGGASVTVIKKISKVIEECGGKLSAGFAVHMPQSMFKKPFENKQKILNNWRKKLGNIYKYINAKKVGRLESDNILLKLTLIPFVPLLRSAMLNHIKKISNLPYQNIAEHQPMYDNLFQIDKNCNGCGICIKVCPVNNIKLVVDKKPSWQHHCENCHACLNWCPQKAIYNGFDSRDKTYYYQNPDVKLSDMLIQK